MNTSLTLTPWQRMLDLMPPLSTLEQQQLAASIKQHGIQNNVLVLPDGRIIDGYHRWMILGDQTPYTVVNLSEEDAYVLGLELNLARRQLTPRQKREISQKLREQGYTQQEVADLTGFSQPAVSGYDQNESNINIDNAFNPHDLRIQVPRKYWRGIADRVASGDSKRQVAADFHITEQRIGQIVSDIERHRQAVEDLATASAVIPEGVTLYHGRFQEQGAKIPDDSIQLILTDPPYGKPGLPLWRGLARLAARVLVPGGFLVSYSGQLYLPTIMSLLSESLDYYWVLALHLQSRNLVDSHHVYNTWKPILVYCKPPVTPPPEYVGDVVEGKGREKALHPWQQNEDEAARLIRSFCPEHGVVLDPMAGSGTTLSAAVKLGRKCIGIEQDEAAFHTIQRRLQP